MSEAIFPTNLPGIKWDRPRRARFKTSVYEALSGAERRIRHRPTPKREIDLSYEVLREQGQGDLQQVLAFFEDRSGAFESFLFRDPYHKYASNTQFGVGDGTTTTFQLLRQVGTRFDAVENPDFSTLTLGRLFFPALGDESDFWPELFGWVDADEYEVPASGFTLLPNGLVQFAVPPTAGKRLLWSGYYYHRARFAEDTLEYNEFMHRLFNLRSLKLVLSLRNIL